MQKKVKDIVYITSCGEKYHINKSCIYIKEKNSISMSLMDAQIKNKFPCKLYCGDTNNNEKNIHINNKINYCKNIDYIDWYDQDNNIFSESTINELNNSDVNKIFEKINVNNEIIEYNNNIEDEKDNKFVIEERESFISVSDINKINNSEKLNNITISFISNNNKNNDDINNDNDNNNSIGEKQDLRYKNKNIQNNSNIFNITNDKLINDKNYNYHINKLNPIYPHNKIYLNNNNNDYKLFQYYSLINRNINFNNYKDNFICQKKWYKYFTRNI